MKPALATVARDCPFCGGPAAGLGFPFASRFEAESYVYRACRECGTRFIDPLPSPQVLARIYAPNDYHDQFYDGDGQGEYQATATLLEQHLPSGASVLDYGCGSGHLVGLLGQAGFAAEGAEFSADAARNAETRTGRPVHDLAQPGWAEARAWDCVHFGDVLEHLTDPRQVLRAATGWLKPGGLISATGPLEANRSLVNGAAALFGQAKRVLRPGRIDQFPPYHLLFANAEGQRQLFRQIEPSLQELCWQVTETGWPYRHNGILRNSIALAAIGVSKLTFGAFGNRFHALYRLGA